MTMTSNGHCGIGGCHNGWCPGYNVRRRSARALLTMDARACARSCFSYMEGGYYRSSRGGSGKRHNFRRKRHHQRGCSHNEQIRSSGHDLNQGRSHPCPDLYDLRCLDHVAGLEPYDLHALQQYEHKVSWFESATCTGIS